jgi:hypothetical protein
MGKWPTKESDLARPMITYLQDLRWEVYQEVEPKRVEAIADLVAVQHGHVWVVELKRTLSLELLAQADYWRRFSHYTSVAVPCSGRRHGKGRIFAEQILRERGIGLIGVEGPGFFKEEPCVRAPAVTPPQLNRSAETKRITESLCDEHKSFSVAGTANGKRWTPFQSTCRQVREAVVKEPGICIKDLVAAISHHYATHAGARASIPHWIRQGVIDGIEMRHEGRYLRLYPVDSDNSAES